MLNPTRRFQIKGFEEHDIEADMAQLAGMLVDRSWTCCQGFRLGDYLFLNDSFGENSAQEYAAIHEATRQQVETITFSWCTKDGAFELILRTLKGDFKPFTKPLPLQLDEENAHHHCMLCA